MKIDASKSASANMLALFLADNQGLAVTADQATFTVKATPEGTTFEGNRNTVVTIAAVEGKGWTGSKDLFVRRLTLTEASPASTTDADGVQVAAGDDQAAALAKVLAAAGLVADEVTVTDFTAASEGSQGAIELTPKDGSLLYLPTATTYGLTVPASTPSFDNRVSNQQLNGWEANNA